MSALRRAEPHLKARSDVTESIGHGLAAIAGWGGGDASFLDRMSLDRDGKREYMPIGYFTAAHVLDALTGSGTTVSAERLRSAWAVFWDQYFHDYGLWGWRIDGRVPSG